MQRAILGGVVDLSGELCVTHRRARDLLFFLVC